MNLASLSTSARRQRGLSMMGLLFWAIIVAFFAVLLIRIYPSVQEYLTTREAVSKVMRADPRPGSIPEIRRNFDKQRQIEYTNSMITGNDLEIEAVADGFQVSFAYDKEVEILDPVFVLIKYRYTTGGK
ncbi:MAG: DUF4845 domain-containing protein [Pseudomonadota bacterium]